MKADLAIKELGWYTPYFVDADHVTFDSVDFFLDSSDFFTLDVADFIGKSTVEENIRDVFGGGVPFDGAPTERGILRRP